MDVCVYERERAKLTRFSIEVLEDGDRTSFPPFFAPAMMNDWGLLLHI